MLRALAWKSQETSQRLTAEEIDTLFKFTREMADLGKLSQGKYFGGSYAIYWERLKGNN